MIICRYISGKIKVDAVIFCVFTKTIFNWIIRAIFEIFNVPIDYIVIYRQLVRISSVNLDFQHYIYATKCIKIYINLLFLNVEKLLIAFYYMKNRIIIIK